MAGKAGGRLAGHERLTMAGGQDARLEDGMLPSRQAGRRLVIPIRSSVSGSWFRLLVRVPERAAPPDGFPVIYAFDGDEHFHLWAEHSAAAETGDEFPTTPVIVTIGYREGEGTVARRIYDLTPSAQTYSMPDRPNGEPWPALGGGDDLLETIERDIKPLVAARFRVDGGKQYLFGHSLGGLMVLHAFASGRGAFNCYIASSPSIWFNDRKILSDISASLNRRMPQPAILRLSVGDREEEPVHPGVRPDEDLGKRKGWVEHNRMVRNARELADMLSARPRGNLHFQFEQLRGLDHGSTVPVAICQAIRAASC